VQLSPHFTSQEFRSADGFGVPLAHANQLRRLCVIYLEPLRSEFGPVKITSGFRSLSYNKEVGGAPQSFHTRISGRLGVAADVIPSRGKPSDWYRFLDHLEPGGLGLYATHVHIDTRRSRARW